jgi:hypothetical protein
MARGHMKSGELPAAKAGVPASACSGEAAAQAQAPPPSATAAAPPAATTQARPRARVAALRVGEHAARTRAGRRRARARPRRCTLALRGVAAAPKKRLGARSPPLRARCRCAFAPSEPPARARRSCTPRAARGVRRARVPRARVGLTRRRLLVDAHFSCARGFRAARAPSPPCSTLPFSARAEQAKWSLLLDDDLMGVIGEARFGAALERAQARQAHTHTHAHTPSLAPPSSVAAAGALLLARRRVCARAACPRLTARRPARSRAG